MAIPIVCLCGRGMLLPEKYAGQHVQCPDCRAMLRIPSKEEDLALMRWFCSCGLRLKARPSAAGRQVKCPRCGNGMTVPLLREEPTLLSEDYVLDEESGIVTIAPGAPAIAQTPQAAEPPSPADAGEALEALAKLEEATTSPPTEEPAAAPAEEPVAAVAPDQDESALDLEKVDTLAEEPDASEADEETYDISVEAAPRPPPPIGARPAAAVQPMPQARARAAADDEEGIRAYELSSYFNADTGIAAMRSGVYQVLNGYWLFIPYVLITGCMSNVMQLLLTHTAVQPGAAIGMLAAYALFGVFLLGGFLGCIKDGVFERAMGIERLLYHGAMNFLNVLGMCVIMAPLFAVAFWGLILVVAAMAIWLGPGFLSLVLCPWAFLFGFVLISQVCLIPVEVCVIERRNPITSLIRIARFIGHHAGQLISLTLASAAHAVFLLFLLSLIWFFVNLWLLILLPFWLRVALSTLAGSLMWTLVFGQMIASFMVLYLSGTDEGHLQEIRSKLRGPGANPILLYAVILILAGSFLALVYHNHVPVFEFIFRSASSG